MMRETSRAERYPLRQRDVVARILAGRSELLLVGGLGPASWDCTAAGDRDLNFMLWGAMGGAVALGLGLAIAQPERQVMVVTGDGEMMMGIGSLATVATQAPANLHIVILDNERFEETGGQLTPTAAGADIEAIARASGIAAASTVRNDADLDALTARLFRAPGPALTVAKVRAEHSRPVLSPRDGNVLRIRFRTALLGTPREAPAIHRGTR